MTTSGPRFPVHFDAARRLIVEVAGELDMATADHLRDVVEAARPLTGPVTLNSERIAFVDSYGLGSLLAIRAACIADTGTPPTLVRPSERLRRLLELTEMTGQFLIEADPPLVFGDNRPG